MFVSCECCVLSGRDFCNKVITHPEVPYHLWSAAVCDLETSIMRRSWTWWNTALPGGGEPFLLTTELNRKWNAVVPAHIKWLP